MAAMTRKMLIISRCQANYRMAKLPGLGLKGLDHSFILKICGDPGLSQDVLAMRLFLNKSTVARTLSRLEEDGYVLRKVSETDKRVTLVYPTEKMLDIYPRVAQIRTEWNVQLAKELGEEEYAAFLAVLDRIEVRARELAEQAEQEGSET
ncbi:MAG: MarR family transcriptional regulator [Clostridia bacterium]|nr:MarR family transcriptional regulator [Clostridia bacterium]